MTVVLALEVAVVLVLVGIKVVRTLAGAVIDTLVDTVAAGM